MDLQLRLMGEGLPTLVAWIWLLDRVGFHMSSKVGTLTEAISAHGAGVGFLSRVGSFVSGQVGLEPETFVTNCTRPRLSFFMSFFVEIVCGQVIENLPALGTGKTTVLGVVPLVFPVPGSGVERFIALIAFVDGLRHQCNVPRGINCTSLSGYRLFGGRPIRTLYSVPRLVRSSPAGVRHVSEVGFGL